MCNCVVIWFEHRDGYIVGTSYQAVLNIKIIISMSTACYQSYSILYQGWIQHNLVGGGGGCTGLKSFRSRADRNLLLISGFVGQALPVIKMN